MWQSTSDTVSFLVITERKTVTTPYATRKPRASLDWVKFDGDLAWDGSVSPNAKAMYAALGRFADLHDRSTPSSSDLAPTRKFLAECIGKSKDTADRAIKELEDHGLLEVERRRDPDNPKLNLPSVYYLLDAERWDEKAAARAAERKAERDARGKKATPDGYPGDGDWRHIEGGRKGAATPENVQIDASLGGRKGAARGGRMDAPTPLGGGRTGAAPSYSPLNGQFEKLEESSSEDARAGVREPAGRGVPAVREEEDAASPSTSNGIAPSSVAPSEEAVQVVRDLGRVPSADERAVAVAVDGALARGHGARDVVRHLARADWSRVRQPGAFCVREVEKYFSGSGAPAAPVRPVRVDVNRCPDCDGNEVEQDDSGHLVRCDHARLIGCPDCSGSGRMEGGRRCGHARSVSVSSWTPMGRQRAA
jgi:DNA-binding transcriptional ArsR family regulator